MVFNFRLHKHMPFRSGWIPDTNENKNWIQTSSEQALGFGLEFSLFYTRHIFHINPFYIPKRTDKYNFFSSYYHFYAKEWITDNCDRTNTFSQLFCYIATSINSAIILNLKGWEWKGIYWLLLCRHVFLFILYLLHKKSPVWIKEKQWFNYYSH